MTWDESQTLTAERAESARTPERRSELACRAEDDYCAYPEDER